MDTINLVRAAVFDNVQLCTVTRVYHKAYMQAVCKASDISRVYGCDTHRHSNTTSQRCKSAAGSTLLYLNRKNSGIVQ